MNIRRATMVIPSLFTVANMALGFFAILSAFQGRWIVASSCIFVGHVMDILDGRFARWVGASSSFGGEIDSFADWLSFGIAPAIMVYLLVLHEFGKFGFVLAFLFILCGATRLARFNVKAMEPHEGPSLHFSGLPTPGAGGFLAVLVLLIALFEQGTAGRTMPILYRQLPYVRSAIPIIVFALSLLMVSKVQYSTFKRTHLFRPQSTLPFLITVLVCSMIYVYPQNTIFILYSSYILWGLLSTLVRAYKLRHKKSL